MKLESWFKANFRKRKRKRIYQLISERNAYEVVKDSSEEGHFHLYFIPSDTIRISNVDGVMCCQVINGRVVKSFKKGEIVFLHNCQEMK